MTGTSGASAQPTMPMAGAAGMEPIDLSPVECKPVQSTEEVPARTAVMSPDVAQPKMVLVRDLADTFKSTCGSCHPGLLDGAKLTWSDKTKPETDPWYARRWAKDIIARMESNTDDYVMPPFEQFHKKWDDHAASGDLDEPIVKLKTRLQAWYETAKDSRDGVSPRTDIFYEPGDPISVSQYTMSEELGPKLTNIGSCLPDKRSIGSDAGAAGQLDAFFAGATELPLKLTDTDLVSFDSEVLARTGVVSFAPAYPLYSDGAHKMRHVRVPQGQSIRFDVDRQEFSIPDNTRFYKTFLRAVVQKDGSTAYRKMETRLIVARADGAAARDGSHATNALYGTYAWNESETEAKLLRDTLRNGEPFQDRLVTYVTDEKKADGALKSKTVDKASALYDAGATRTYAIPGALRCVQCHMGSHTRSFVLGFTPLQIKRRATGEGGTYEPASEDELGQLQRLIDYGVITGVKSLDDIVPLEESQGDRKYRNTYELAAQAYMMGNCAGCHNPRGYPTVENPSLRDLLNFFPERDCGGGIFQFPLERTSPRITLKDGQEIPYISPSLIDYDFDPNVGTSFVPESHMVFDRDGRQSDTTYYVAAPWRSLIYRNVDTPFIMSHDSVIYPHMPLNTPGFDARAPKIMGEWMVSIPARLISTMKSEHETPTQPYVEVRPDDAQYVIEAGNARTRMMLYRNGGRRSADDFPLKDGKGNPTAGHLFTMFVNDRYQLYAPDTADIVDHDLLSTSTDNDALRTYAPGDKSMLPSLWTRSIAEPTLDSGRATWLRYSALANGDGVPDRPHWVVSDITDLPPPWTPRRTDWADVLTPHSESCKPTMEQDTCADKLTICSPWQLLNCNSWATGLSGYDTIIKDQGDGVCKQQSDKPRGSAECPCKPDELNCDPAQRPALAVLKELATTDLTPGFVDFAKTRVPFGLWQESPDCKFEDHGVRTVSAFTDEQKWSWMIEDKDQNRPAADPSRHVYEQSYGAAVFGEICVNCHGKKADSRGRQADNLMLITGGATRVANLRDGMFGGIAEKLNRTEVFEGHGMPSDTLAARYMAWMALGGTTSKIDGAILALVGNTAVFGVARPDGYGLAKDGNMLSFAKILCKQTEGLVDAPSSSTILSASGKLLISSSESTKPPFYEFASYIDSNGDGEVWRRLCDYENPRPVWILVPENAGVQTDKNLKPQGYYSREGYPAGETVGDHRGLLQNGLSADNHMPWCVMLDPTKADSQTILDAIVKDRRNGKPLPICPTEAAWPRKRASDADLDAWAIRGAINAGKAVFVFMSDRTEDSRNGIGPQPSYDDCGHLGCPENPTPDMPSCGAQAAPGGARMGCE